MKTLGATRWQVMGWLTGEAMLLGVAGALVGSALGTGLALLLLGETGLALCLEPRLFDLGVRGAVTRYVARYRSTHEHDTASRLASTALTAFAAAGLLAIAVSAGLALVIGRSRVFRPRRRSRAPAARTA